MKCWQKIVLIILIILIIIMGILILSNFKKEDRLLTESKNIYLEGNSFQNINIPYKEIKKENEFNFKIKNYSGNKVNEKEIIYTVKIITSKNLSAELFNKDKENILKDNITEELVLKKGKKEHQNFKLKIKYKKIEKKDFVRIQIKAWEK